MTKTDQISLSLYVLQTSRGTGGPKIYVCRPYACVILPFQLRKSPTSPPRKPSNNFEPSGGFTAT